MTTNAAAGPWPRAGLKEWIALAVLALPATLVSIDVSVMILALPHIGASLGADCAQHPARISDAHAASTAPLEAYPR